MKPPEELCCVHWQHVALRLGINLSPTCQVVQYVGHLHRIMAMVAVSEDLMLFFVISDRKMNPFWFLIVGWMKQAI